MSNHKAIPQNDNQEIEIKVKISEKALSTLKLLLSSNAEYKGEFIQNEYYLDNPDNSWFLQHKTGYKYANKYLRVRMTKKGDWVCFKNWEASDTAEGYGTYCKDIEYQVSSGEKAISLFQAIGYTDITSFKKIRSSYIYKGIEISIDTVEDLGTFVEFEIKERKFIDPAAEYQRLISFLEKDLQITKYKLQKQGFIIMLLNPDFQFV